VTDKKRYTVSTYIEAVETKDDLIKDRKRSSFKNIDKNQKLEMPSKLEMVKSVAKSIGKTARAALSGMEVVSGAELVEKRTSICRACPWFVPKGQRCAKCGCVVPLKAYFKEEECPIGKW
jgi:hypothetical protein